MNDISKDKEIQVNYNQIVAEIERLRLAITTNDPASIPALVAQLNVQLLSLSQNVSRNYIKSPKMNHPREQDLEISFHKTVF